VEDSWIEVNQFWWLRQQFELEIDIVVFGKGAASALCGAA
jgi:hypothetical protein